MTLFAFLLLFAVSLFGFFLNRQAAVSIRAGGQSLHSLPQFHGGYSALLIFVPGFIVLILWVMLQGVVIKSIVICFAEQPTLRFPFVP